MLGVAEAAVAVAVVVVVTVTASVDAAKDEKRSHPRRYSAAGSPETDGRRFFSPSRRRNVFSPSARRHPAPPSTLPSDSDPKGGNSFEKYPSAFR